MRSEVLQRQLLPMKSLAASLQYYWFSLSSSHSFKVIYLYKLHPMANSLLLKITKIKLVYNKQWYSNNNNNNKKLLRVMQAQFSSLKTDISRHRYHEHTGYWFDSDFFSLRTIFGLWIQCSGLSSSTTEELQHAPRRYSIPEQCCMYRMNQSKARAVSASWRLFHVVGFWCYMDMVFSPYCSPDATDLI